MWLENSPYAGREDATIEKRENEMMTNGRMNVS